MSDKQRLDQVDLESRFHPQAEQTMPVYLEETRAEAERTEANRPVKTKEHLAFLDSLRGVAILLVFLVHCLNPAFNMHYLKWSGIMRDFHVSRSFLLVLPATLGWAGVPVFFAVSGFCIHLSFQRKPDWIDFTLRRFFRIYPPYLVALLIFALAYPLTRLSFTHPGDVGQLLSHLLLIHNSNPVWRAGISDVFWSIAVEVQLYVLYPLLLVLTGRLGWWRTLTSIGLIEVILRTISSTPALPFAFWLSWSLGAFVADAYLKKRPIPFATWSVPLMLSVSVGSTFVSFLENYSFLFFSWTTAALIARLVSGAPTRLRLPPMLSRHLLTAGLWSYSFYLIHGPLLAEIGRQFPTFPGRYGLLRFAICVSSWFIFLPLSGIMHRWCEIPSIALGKKAFKLWGDRPARLAGLPLR